MQSLSYLENSDNLLMRALFQILLLAYSPLSMVQQYMIRMERENIFGVEFSKEKVNLSEVAEHI